MTEPMPDPDLEEAFVGTAPAGDANPEDYMSNDQQGGVSEETGTTYDKTGEPETTPHDVVLDATDEEEA